MNSIIELLLSLADSGSLIYVLLLVVLKSSVLLLVALAITKIFSNLSSAKKHFIWAVTFFIILLLPLLSVVLPRWELPVPKKKSLNLSEESVVGVQADRERSDSMVPEQKKGSEAQQVPVSADNDTYQNGNQMHGKYEAESSSLISTLFSDITSMGLSVVSNNRFLSFVQLIWLTGVIILLFKQFSAHMLIYRISKNSVVLNDAGWNSVFTDIQSRYSISRKVKLLKNDTVKSPMTWGIISPKIIIPSDMELWTETKKRYALIHECAHIKRRDLFVQLLGGLVCMIQWFNPLVWISYNKMSAECEHACDDYVLERCKNPSAYAKLLLEVAESSLQWSYSSSVVITMAKSNHLEERILSILKKEIARSKITLGTALITILGIFLLSFSMIVFSPFEGNTEELVNFTNIMNASASILENDLDPSISHIGEQPNQVDYQDTSTVAVLTEILYDDNQDVRLQAAESLGKIGTEEAVQQVVIALPRNNWNDLDEVVDVFNDLKKSYPLHTLMNSIKGKERDIRREAIFSLNDAPSVYALDPLCDYMDDEDSEIREEAGKGLGRIGVPEALECLSLHLKDDDQDVRIEVIEAIGKIQDKKAVPALSEALNDKSWRVREEAASALGAIKDPAAVNQLSLALNDDHWRVRDEAAEALGKIGDKTAVESLTKALKKERNNEVKREMLSAIGNIFSQSN